VARKLRGTLPNEVEVLEREGEPTGLIDAWGAGDEVWLIDAVVSGARPGTVHRLDATADALPAELFRTSTHHFGLAEAVEIARAVGRLPARLVVYGIEGASFDTGDRLSAEVEAAAAQVVAALREEVLARTSRP
jgi:hydrogenase maturation protease